MSTLTPLSHENIESLDISEPEEPSLSYKKGPLGAWAVLLLILVALLSYSDFAHISIISTLLYGIVFACVSTRLLSFCYGWIKKNQPAPLSETNLDSHILLPSPERNTSTQARPRLHYLDNVKVFLTALVVSHHVSCSFGGCGANSWTIMIGLHSPEDLSESPIFTKCLSSFALLNQSYFMSLFFFISAYFVPSSYLRKELWEFHYERAKRYLIPFYLVFFIIMPIAILIALATSGSPFDYVMNYGPAWFLFWLIIFNTVYSSSTVKNTSGLVIKEMKMPKFLVREGIGGILICGLCMFGVIVALSKRGDFFFMPIAMGSLINDVFFFIMGILAYHNHWLEIPLRDQIDFPIWFLRLLTIVEAILIIACMELEYWIPLFILTGLFCIDMSLVVLEFFQTYADQATALSKYLSSAAYGVYIIHPVVVTAFTCIFVVIYNATGVGDGIQFEDFTMSYSQLVGPDKGGLVLFFGWFVCNILSHAVLWPLAHWMKTLPGLKQIL